MLTFFWAPGSRMLSQCYKSIVQQGIRAVTCTGHFIPWTHSQDECGYSAVTLTNSSTFIRTAVWELFLCPLHLDVSRLMIYFGGQHLEELSGWGIPVLTWAFVHLLGPGSERHRRSVYSSQLGLEKGNLCSVEDSTAELVQYFSVCVCIKTSCMSWSTLW
jgi:hypothetical protein